MKYDIDTWCQHYITKLYTKKIKVQNTGPVIEAHR